MTTTMMGVVIGIMMTITVMMTTMTVMMVSMAQGLKVAPVHIISFLCLRNF